MAALEGAHYRHPFLAADVSGAPPGDAFRLWFADYVTADTGTGLVHTAPGHGADDFKTGMVHGLPAYAPLDDSGRYFAGVRIDGGPELTGLSTDEANPLIVAHLAKTGHLLNPPTDQVQHSYAHCWRCKEPIVFRATPQWFIAMDHDGFRDRALAEIDRTTWIPPWGHDRIYAMIAEPARLGAVAPAAVGHADPDVPLQASAARAHAERRHDGARRGDLREARAPTRGGRAPSPSWCRRGRVREVRRRRRPARAREGHRRRLVRVRRVVAGDGGARPATTSDIDLYLEGSDQHRGWFHSSLLAGVGVQGKAPYRQVITHGFVLDEHGNPYSKSRSQRAKAEGKKTSYIEPDSVIAKSGAELFRLWVGVDRVPQRHHRTRRPSSTGSPSGTASCATPRGSCSATSRTSIPIASRSAPTPSTLGIDRYLLARLDVVVARARKAYEAYEFHVVHRLLVEFVTVDLSALYCDVTKDRLYCDAADSPPRRAAQAVLYDCLRALATLAAPILCFTAEDIWTLHAAARGRSRQRAPRRVSADGRRRRGGRRPAAVRQAAGVARAGQPVRSSRSAPPATSRPTRGSPCATRRATALLPAYGDELADLFIVSDVALEPGEGRRRPGRAPHRAALRALLASTSTPSPPTRTTCASVAPRRCAR